ncbi:MAG: anti-sigma factor [Ignavibacteriaceae bacterium]|nr:anti-sigma factor [Ignavibacteriaceae bacterium]
MAGIKNLQSHNEYSELLFAYSLGCLDKDDLLLLEEYLQAGNEFPWQELGEYQNLVALLPSILNMETPGPELKDKVARKLYRIKNERRTKKAPESIIRNKTVSEVKANPPAEEKAELSGYFEQSRSSVQNNAADEKEKPDEEPSQFQTDFSSVQEDSNAEPAKESASPLSQEQNNITNVDEIDTLGTELNETPATQETIPVKEEKKPYRLHGISEEKKEKKNISGIVTVIIILLLVLAGLFYFYQKFSTDVNKYKLSVDNLNKQVAGLTIQLSVNKEVDKILQMKDAHIINLYNTSINKEGFGKVIISFENSSGFLQLSDLPVLSNDKYYQLWMTSEKTTTSLGVCKPSGNLSYFPIALPSQNYKGEIRFFVTVESSNNASTPSNKIYLTGVLK